MAGKNHVTFVNDQRIQKAELSDADGDLPLLLSRMSSGALIVAVGYDRFGAPEGCAGGLASWPCLSRPSTRFGASSAGKLGKRLKTFAFVGSCSGPRQCRTRICCAEPRSR